MEKEEIKEILDEEVRAKIDSGNYKVQVTDQELVNALILLKIDELEKEGVIENAQEYIEVERTSESSIDDFKDKAEDLRDLLRDNPEIYDKLSETEKKVSHIIGAKP